MYNKIQWKNHVVQYPHRRKIIDNLDETYTIEPAPGEIIQLGTKQSAENFNHMDEGIFDVNLAQQIILQANLHSDVTEYFTVDDEGKILIEGYVTEETLNQELGKRIEIRKDETGYYVFDPDEE